MVTLDAPPLATAIASSRVLSPRVRHARLDLRSLMSVSYLDRLASDQRILEARIRAAIPQAEIRWHYEIVLNGLAVVAPASAKAKLAALPGVAHVYSSVLYHAHSTGADVIGAPALWGTTLATAGQGMKIGIVDDGVDQAHRYFSPAGFSMPPGYPKGNTSYTTSKVIVARAFAPPRPKWRYASRPFDPSLSDHATHVAGIAAGDYNTSAFGERISGVAPKAFIGNYKVLTIPTPDFGLDGNSPEIAAGIEAAVRDGMDVINLSLGEPEVNPARDLVVKAIDGAATAGVVPAIAAGNDFQPFGAGSVSSPGSAAKAITAAAATKQSVIAGFSSGGPTPVSLRMKPDVSAPGVSILSSVPPSEGTWASWDGTSMASPHVAGAAALLRQRHPKWTVAQIKSALVQTGDPVRLDAREAAPTREGGGMINLPKADKPLLFANPADVSYGCVHAGKSVSRRIVLQDAGGGAGTWTVGEQSFGDKHPVTLDAPATVSVPGRFNSTVVVARGAKAGDASGFITLRRSGQLRRIPYWYCISNPRLSRHRHRALSRTGTYDGNTAGQRALVSRYRYPDLHGGGIATLLRGPEQVFRFRLNKKVANFGVAVLSQGRDVHVHPRVVFAGDENRLVGYTALPLDLNPYLAIYGRPVSAAGAVVPAKSAYDIVFDTTSRSQAGKFRFRFWINDTKPPAARLTNHSIRVGGSLRVSATDTGSGVDPGSIFASVDGREIDSIGYSRSSHRITVDVPPDLGSGTHRLTLQLSDFQESRNMENVGPILPNTRVLKTTFRIR